MAWWARVVLTGAEVLHDVRITAEGGLVTAVDARQARRGGDVVLDVVVPGFVNAHSHAFHRALRGRTHDGGGTFWTWRTAMYDVAQRLDPDSYRLLATAVYADMVAAGWTAVGEFHYLHHAPGGAPYEGHAMELALADAARATGIRLTLLDTCYLAGGIGAPLAPEQTRFGDVTAARFLERWHALAQALPAGVVLGAAVHSVRAVPPEAIAEVVAGLPDDVPLHVHLSEQVGENTDCLAAYGLTPTQVLERAGALGPRLSVVHATHLTDGDVELLGAAGVSVVMCPTTEADLGDGIGPARRLADAGARVCLGSDQHAVLDPLLEVRALEAGERLGAQARGRFTPAELLTAATTAGARSLCPSRAVPSRTAGERPLEAHFVRELRNAGAGEGLVVGARCDLVELDAGSARTAGSAPEQLLLTASAADVRRVIVGGELVAQDGRLTAPGVEDPARLLREALA